jgi:Protein of unknown function (DUF1326)
MTRILTVAALGLILTVAAQPARAGNPAGITGHYLESRSCDVWTGPCFANAEVNLGGKHAVIGWKVDQGALGGVRLDGLGVVAVVEASDTLGVSQTGPSRAILIVDRRATSVQRDALVRLARSQAGELLRNVVSVKPASVQFMTCACKNNVCAVLNAGVARVETGCLDEKQHKVCGNESPFFPPLAKNVKVKAALTVESCFTGKGIKENWKENGRRSAYVGSFEIR